MNRLLLCKQNEAYNSFNFYRQYYNNFVIIHCFHDTGNQHSGFMGVSVAYPLKHFIALDIQLARVGDELDDNDATENQDSKSVGTDSTKVEQSSSMSFDAFFATAMRLCSSTWQNVTYFVSSLVALKNDNSTESEDSQSTSREEKGSGGNSSRSSSSRNSKKNSTVKDVFDVWDMSRKRSNVMINVKFKCVNSETNLSRDKIEDFENGKVATKEEANQGVFVVSNYHMPCVFWSPPVMVIHSSTAMQLALKFASQNKMEQADKGENKESDSVYRLPSVFAGDFNIKPTDDAYRLLTSGRIDDERYDYFHDTIRLIIYIYIYIYICAL